MPFTPTVEAAPQRLGLPLPKTGRAGDLMTIVDDQGHCTLWFCVEEAQETTIARWSEVLLGPPTDGTA